MNKKPKYQIGDFVIVSNVQTREKKGNTITWRTALPLVTTCPRIGQVVGLCTRFDGRVELEDYYSLPHFSAFVPSKSHRFWLVRFGLTNRAVEVAEEDIRRISPSDIPPELPYRWPPQKMSERDKQNMREDSKFWPRTPDSRKRMRNCEI